VAKERQESGDERQERIRREQHRPEQDRGYDKAVHGGAAGPDAPRQPDADEAMQDRGESLTAEVDEREARRAADEVRRAERSAEKTPRGA
jgi:hypothetical protein